MYQPKLTLFCHRPQVSNDSSSNFHIYHICTELYNHNLLPECVRGLTITTWVWKKVDNHYLNTEEGWQPLPECGRWLNNYFWQFEEKIKVVAIFYTTNFGATCMYLGLTANKHSFLFFERHETYMTWLVDIWPPVASADSCCDDMGLAASFGSWGWRLGAVHGVRGWQIWINC